MQRNILISFLLLLTPIITLSAQSTVSRTFSASGAENLEMDFEWADVKLSSWEGDEVKISGTVNIADGTENDAFELEARQNGNSLSIRGYLNRDIKGGWGSYNSYIVIKDGKTYIRKQKNGKTVEVEAPKDTVIGAGNQNPIDIRLTIQAPADRQLKLACKYGDIELDNFGNAGAVVSKYGGIDAAFPSGRLPERLVLESKYDYVDVSLPKSTAADIEMDTDYGKIFTDLNVAIDRRRSRRKNYGDQVIGTLSGGGPRLTLRAKYDNIYLRGDRS